MSPLERDVSDLARDDIVLPYTVESLSTRGRLVRLGPAIDAILKRHAYPEPVGKVVGEAAALAVLLGSTLKLEGRFQLQTKTDGALSMLVVDFDAPSNSACSRPLRRKGAREPIGWGRRHPRLRPPRLHDRRRGAGLAPPGRDRARGPGIERAAHVYFERSEQIPTLVRLAVGQSVTPEGVEWRAGGLLVQFLPDSPERRRHVDFDPGDGPPGFIKEASPEDDEWIEAKSRAATTEDHELIDPTLSSERLLFRLFNERGVRVADPTPLKEACRCSAEKIDAMLQSFSAEERGRDGRRRRANRRRLRILLGQARLRSCGLRRMKSSPRKSPPAQGGEVSMDMSAFAVRLAEVGAEVEAELEELLALGPRPQELARPERLLSAMRHGCWAEANDCGPS